jgi:Domain of unknown function (DUF4397)
VIIFDFKHTTKLAHFFTAIILCAFLYGCLKTEDNTATAPKANLNVANLALNAPAVTININAATFNILPLTYGNNTATGNIFYNSVSPGIQNMQITGGTATYLNGNVPFEANKYYSLILADSFTNNSFKTIFIKDDTATNHTDSLTLLRILHVLPGTDTFTLRLLNTPDTATYASLAYQQNLITNAFTAAPFNKVVKQGRYRLDLFKNNVSVFNGTVVNLQARHLYTLLIYKGAGGPQVKILKNK